MRMTVMVKMKFDGDGCDNGDDDGSDDNDGIDEGGVDDDGDDDERDGIDEGGGEDDGEGDGDDNDDTGDDDDDGEYDDDVSGCWSEVGPRFSANLMTLMCLVCFTLNGPVRRSNAVTEYFRKIIDFLNGLSIHN